VAKAQTRASGIHLIAGPDSFLAEEALEDLLSSFLGDDRAEAIQVFRGEETTWSRVVEAARTGSLFVSRRAIVVRGAQAIAGEGDELLAYLEDPSPGVCLIILAIKVDKRRKLWKRLFDGAQVVSAEPLKGQRLRGFVTERLKRRRLLLTEEGLEELLERVGADLRRLMGEVDKLEAYAGGAARKLTAEDVAAVSGRGFAQPLYLLADGMASRQALRVLELAEGLLDEGEEGLRILATLIRSLRQVRAARAMSASGLPREEMARRLGLPPNMVFKLPGILDAARQWSEVDLERGLFALRRADRALKRGAAVRTTLTAAVVAGCGARPGGASPERRSGR
jgi:DNA polymerase-3 subunit delta